MQKSISALNKIILIAFLPLILIAITGLGEVYMHLFVEIPSPPYNNKVKDYSLGWKSKPGYHYQTDNFPDNKGGSYPVTVNFDSHGFRKWKVHHYDSVQKKILFLGDSYLESLQASDEKLFYFVIKDSLPVTVSNDGTTDLGRY